MPELREVFEMTTKQIEPDMDSWREQEGRQRRSTRNKKIGALAVAAVIGVAAVALILGTRGGQNATTPASEPPTVAPVDAEAQAVATGFLEAFGAFDVKQAITYLADGADLTQLGGGTLGEFRLFISWLEASGYKQMLNSCEELSSLASETRLRCAFDFQGLRSDEIGLGPFSGSYFDLTVRDGRIVRASVSFGTEEFSPQMWEPFAKWVSKAYPEDAAVMYNSDYTDYRLSEESIRLWKLHTREYVKEVGRP